MSSITPVIDASIKVPGIYIEVALGVGVQSASDIPMKGCLYGNKTSSGSQAVATVVQVFDEDQARTLFGAGSELFLMCRAFLKTNPNAQLWATVITESAGTAASLTLTYTGPSTVAGSQSVTCLGETVSVSIASGTADTAVATAVAALINAQTDWPVTAAAVGAVVTVTAKHKGPRGNAIALRATSSTTGVTVTPGAGTGYLGSGATSDTPQTALDNNAPIRFDYHVAPYDDATNLTIFETHVDTYSGPTHGKRQRVIAAHTGTVSAVQTVSASWNAVRGQFVHLEDADDTPAMLAAMMCATRILYESRNRAANMDNYALPYAKPQNDSADIPTNSELTSLLNNGVTPLMTTADGKVVIVRSITNRHKDTAGNLNYSVLDSHKVVVPDYAADVLSVRFIGEWPNMLLKDDDASGKPPPENTATPRLLKDWSIGVMRQLENEEGILENVTANVPRMIFQKASSPDGRVNARIPIDVVEQLHQLGIQLRQEG